MDTKATPNIDNRLSLILGIIVLLLIILATSWILVSIIPSLSTEFTVGIITAALTIISIFVSKNVEQNTLIKNELRQKKIPVYEEYIKFLFKILESQKAGKSLNEQELTEFMLKFIQELLVWGADDVVIAFLKFKQASNSQHDDPNAILFATEDLLLAIRRDLGHSNKDFSKGTLLGLFIVDIDKLKQ